jgi:hypothetical protein
MTSTAKDRRVTPRYAIVATVNSEGNQRWNTNRSLRPSPTRSRSSDTHPPRRLNVAQFQKEHGVVVKVARRRKFRRRSWRRVLVYVSDGNQEGGDVCRLWRSTHLVLPGRSQSRREVLGLLVTHSNHNSFGRVRYLSQEVGQWIVTCRKHEEATCHYPTSVGALRR